MLNPVSRWSTPEPNAGCGSKAASMAANGELVLSPPALRKASPFSMVISKIALFRSGASAPKSLLTCGKHQQSQAMRFGSFTDQPTRPITWGPCWPWLVDKSPSRSNRDCPQPPSTPPAAAPLASQKTAHLSLVPLRHRQSSPCKARSTNRPYRQPFLPWRRLAFLVPPYW